MTEVSDGVRADDAIVATAPDGRRMLRIEARNAEVPIEKKPSWIKTTLRTGPEFRRITGLTPAAYRRKYAVGPTIAPLD